MDHGPGFGDHGSRVAILALATAHKMGVNSRDIDRLHFAAFIHDVGKTRIEPAILEKAGALTVEETDIVREHPQIGYDQLRDIVHVSVAEAVLSHHERWDGAGYPHGLKQDEIPLFARIIYVADAFDVMTSSRGYRATSTVGEAGSELARHAGRQFDPAVVDAFASLDRELLETQSNPVRPEPRLYA